MARATALGIAPCLPEVGFVPGDPGKRGRPFAAADRQCEGIKHRGIRGGIPGLGDNLGGGSRQAFLQMNLDGRMSARRDQGIQKARPRVRIKQERGQPHGLEPLMKWPASLTLADQYTLSGAAPGRSSKRTAPAPHCRNNAGSQRCVGGDLAHPRGSMKRSAPSAAPTFAKNGCQIASACCGGEPLERQLDVERAVRPGR